MGNLLALLLLPDLPGLFMVVIWGGDSSLARNLIQLSVKDIKILSVEDTAGPHMERNNLNLFPAMNIPSKLTLFLLVEKVNITKNVNHVRGACVPCVKVCSILDIVFI